VRRAKAEKTRVSRALSPPRRGRCRVIERWHRALHAAANSAAAPKPLAQLAEKKEPREASSRGSALTGGSRSSVTAEQAPRSEPSSKNSRNGRPVNRRVESFRATPKAGKNPHFQKGARGMRAPATQATSYTGSAPGNAAVLLPTRRTSERVGLWLPLRPIVPGRRDERSLHGPHSGHRPGVAPSDAGSTAASAVRGGGQRAAPASTPARQRMLKAKPTATTVPA
jgi:hypothetical protein